MTGDGVYSQRFYDTDLLYNDVSREREATNGSNPGGIPAASRSNTDIEAGRVSQTKEYSQLPPSTPVKQPWYKTRNGIIAIVIIALVVVGAVVGGAVGRTQAKKKSPSPNSDDTTTPQSSDSVLSASIPVTTTQAQTAGIGTDSSSTTLTGSGLGLNISPGGGNPTLTADTAQAT